MKKNLNLFLHKIITLAQDNVKKNKCGPFAAAVVKNGKIVSYACNVVTKKNDPTAHAETEAIRKAAKKLQSHDLSGCEMYASCEPCPMCLGAIYWANIKKIYYCAGQNTATKYGFKDALILKELKKTANKRRIKQIFVPAAESELPFKEWRSASGKKKY
ncbi:MAG: nucleoside deaminase [Endomicrobia bacterium]|nr:nucleoside deaminase [Endomicrobiia bacterium]